MRRTALALALFALPLFSAYAVDTAPKPDIYAVHEEIVIPSMIPQYEAVAKEMFSAMAEKNVTSPYMRFNAYMSPDLHYFYITRLEGGISGVEPMMNAWMTLAETIGKERYAAIERRSGVTISSYNDFLVMRRPDLSYVPAAPRLKPDEHTYVRWQFYYLKPGSDREAEAIARDYVALFKLKNIGDGFTIYTGLIGQDLPLLIAAVGAKGPADYAASDEAIVAALGADLKALQARALGVTRRLETREAFYRPDLSYPPPKAPAAK